MAIPKESLQTIQELVQREGRYRVQAYVFALEALSVTLEARKREGYAGHIDGRQLLLGIRDYARKEFGYLALAVFREWGVERTLDFGVIVFTLIDAHLLSRQETDTIDDFADVYSFAEAFEQQFIH